MSTNLDAKHIVDFLNDAHKADPAVLTTLFNVRRVCNKDLAEHPHVQVRGVQVPLPQGKGIVAD